MAVTKITAQYPGFAHGALNWDTPLKADITALTAEANSLSDVSQVYLYRPANSTALAALAGMSIGDLAVRGDTNVTYRYLGSSAGWRPWESDWIDYTVTIYNLTLGSGGFASGRYKWVAGEVLTDFIVQFGSGLNITGAIQISMPFSTSGSGYMASNKIDGGAELYHAGSPARIKSGRLYWFSANVLTLNFEDATAGNDLAPCDATHPWTWAATDYVRGRLLFTPA